MMRERSICNDNDVFVEPLPLDDFGTRYKLQVRRPGKQPLVGKNEYDSTKSEWILAVYKIYNHFYTKYYEKNTTKQR